MPLTLEPNFHQAGRRFVREFSAGDEFYEALLNAHQELSDEQSALLNAKLVLLLANHVGDLNVIREALALARAGLSEQTGAS